MVAAGGFEAVTSAIGSCQSGCQLTEQYSRVFGVPGANWSKRQMIRHQAPVMTKIATRMCESNKSGLFLIQVAASVEVVTVRRVKMTCSMPSGASVRVSLNERRGVR